MAKYQSGRGVSAVDVWFAVEVIGGRAVGWGRLAGGLDIDWLWGGTASPVTPAADVTEGFGIDGMIEVLWGCTRAVVFLLSVAAGITAVLVEESTAVTANAFFAGELEGSVVAAAVGFGSGLPAEDAADDVLDRCEMPGVTDAAGDCELAVDFSSTRVTGAARTFEAWAATVVAGAALAFDAVGGRLTAAVVFAIAAGELVAVDDVLTRWEIAGVGIVLEVCEVAKVDATLVVVTLGVVTAAECVFVAGVDAEAGFTEEPVTAELGSMLMAAIK
jgi:hypothetical protein